LLERPRTLKRSYQKGIRTLHLMIAGEADDVEEELPERNQNSSPGDLIEKSRTLKRMILKDF